MRNQRYMCRNCGCEFEEKIFEKGEAKEKGIPTGPVRCKRCKSTRVKPI